MSNKTVDREGRLVGDDKNHKPWIRATQSIRDNGHTVTSLGLACGISRIHLAQIFSRKGTKLPSLGLAAKIAAELEITLDELWDILCDLKGEQMQNRTRC